MDVDAEWDPSFQRRSVQSIREGRKELNQRVLLGRPLRDNGNDPANIRVHGPEVTQVFWQHPLIVHASLLVHGFEPARNKTRKQLKKSVDHFMAKKPSKPEPTQIKIDGDWKEAIARSFLKTKPEGGWPKPNPMPQRAPKTPRNRKKKPD
ncbi:MAG: hypothetical protein JST05_09530 [Acidobacteria bacterium]|nr:hypothetical protein [Acidobacteriota bacterium]